MAKKAKALRLKPTAPRERPLWDTLNSMAAAVERWDYVPPSLLDRRSAAQALRYMADYFWVQENGPAPGKANGTWLTKKRAQLADEYQRVHGCSLKAAVQWSLGEGSSGQEAKVIKQVQLLRARREKIR